MNDYDNIEQEDKLITIGTSACTVETMFDLRDLEYVHQVDHNLICPICRCPYIEPTRLSCDHTFCKQCLGTAFRSQSRGFDNTCPTCRRHTTRSGTLPLPRFIINLVDELLVYCPNSTAGCTITSKRSEVQLHVEHYCDYTEVLCPSQDCKLTVKRIKCKGLCVHVMVCCGICRLEMMRRDLEEHLTSHCVLSNSSCPRCETLIKLYDRGKHFSECRAITHPCSASSIGCKFTGNQREINVHECECALVAILPTLTSMSSLIENQQSALQIQQRKCERLDLILASIANSNSLEEFQQTDSNYNNLFEGNSPEAVQTTRHGPKLQSSPNFDSTTRHLLSLHESLRAELDRLSAALSELDARASMLIMNESLRTKEDLAHTSAAIGSLRAQVQWLTSARVHAQSHSLTTDPNISKLDSRSMASLSSVDHSRRPMRRLSDSSTKVTKL